MLNIENIKSHLPNHLVVTGGGDNWRIAEPNGDFIADLDLKARNVHASLDLLTTVRSELELTNDEIDDLIPAYDEAFCAEFMPAWKEAGFTLDCVEDATGDAAYIMITARIEAICSDEAALASRIAYLREHLEQASGAIWLL